MRATKWPSLPLRRLGQIVGGGTPTPDAENWGGAIPFVTPPDLRPVVGRTVETTDRTLTVTGAESGSALVPAGSVLLSIRAPIGYVARTATEAAFNQGCRAIVPHDRVDASYLAYALIAATPELEAMGRGTTFTELSAAQMAAIEVPAPPFAQQRAIADYLDRETAQIDELITEQQRLIDLLVERRRAVLDAGTSGANGELIKLRYLFAPSSDTNYPEEQVLSVYRDYGVIPKASRDDNFNRTPENLERYLLVRPGDLVVNRMKAWQGSLGISDHRGIVSGDYEVARPASGRLLAGFAHLVLRSPKMIAEYAVRSTGIRPSQWRLYWDQLSSIEMRVPTREVQEALVARLSEQIDKIDGLVTETERFIELARERRAALITAAVTGQIDVGIAA